MFGMAQKKKLHRDTLNFFLSLKQIINIRDIHILFFVNLYLESPFVVHKQLIG